MSDWLRPPHASQFHHANPAKCPHVSHPTGTTPLLEILHCRTGAPPNPCEGERWIITQVLFSYSLDATSNPNQLLSAADVINCSVLLLEKRKEAEESVIKRLGLWIFLHVAVYTHFRHSLKYGLQHYVLHSIQKNKQYMWANRCEHTL